MGERGAELAAGLEAVHRRIADAAAAAGRDPEEITLVVVTKYFPESDVRLLAGLGVRHVGENRHQEAEVKAASCADLGLVWHFIGSLQSNKAAAVARYAGVVESVDRAKLVAGLGRGARERADGGSGDRPLDCLVQVSLDGPGSDSGAAGRGGALPSDVPDLAARIAEQPSLRLRGVMAVAPLGRPPGPAFERLAEVAAEVRAAHPDATWISAGMSQDLEEAIAHGATHVRVGSAILGPRPVIK